MIPFIIESSGHGERAYDIYSRLLKERIVFIGEIEEHSAQAIIAQLLYLELEDKSKDISLYIMSPGGSINSSLAIYDTMQFITNDVRTFGIGIAASAAAFLLAAGTKGKRFALPSSSVMIHQPMGGTMGQVQDIKIYTDEVIRMRSYLYEKLAKHTGKTVKQLALDCDRDHYMNAKEALDYGIIDKIVEKRPA
jgi:ATP-dependent Clp protease protease subunit